MAWASATTTELSHARFLFWSVNNKCRLADMRGAGPIMKCRPRVSRAAPPELFSASGHSDPAMTWPNCLTVSSPQALALVPSPWAPACPSGTPSEAASEASNTRMLTGRGRGRRVSAAVDRRGGRGNTPRAAMDSTSCVCATRVKVCEGVGVRASAHSCVLMRVDRRGGRHAARGHGLKKLRG